MSKTPKTPVRKCACNKRIRNEHDTSCSKCKGRLTRGMKTQLKKMLGVRPVRKGNFATLLMNNTISQMVDAMITPPAEAAKPSSAPSTPVPAKRPPGIYKVPRKGNIPAGEVGVL